MSYLLVSILTIVTLLFLVGLFLPKEKIFTKKTTLNSDLNKVFQIVTDFKNQHTWRNDVKEIIEVDEKTWTEVPKKGMSITFRVVKKVENEIFKIEIIEPNNFTGYWVGTFKKTNENQTIIEFKEVVSVSNPLFRTLSWIFLDLNKTMDLYLQNLKQKLGE